MWTYEQFKKKLFLRKKEKATELTDTDLLQMFKEEVSNEISVNLIKKQREDI